MVDTRKVANGPPATSDEASLASLGIEPVKISPSLYLMFPGWEKYDFEHPRINIDGIMTGNNSGDENMLQVSVRCEIPSPQKAQYWDAPGQWNCSVLSYKPYPGGARAISHDYFGQKPGYYGDFYWPHDKEGKLVPAEERQPRLTDGGTGMLFPDLSLDSPGSMSVTCSKPLRDLARSTDLEQGWDGCTVTWKNMFLPEEIRYKMTIGHAVTIPGLYVAANPKSP
ncbi:MAG: hypothetical protein KDA35_03360 [Hyphomonadaceae bacterium]|nr:hypothetical protein [Hyphomonadaceae bacterium]